MLELTEKYNLDRINYLKQNKSKITEEILDELRSFGLAGKQIALDILELEKNENIQDIHCVEIQKCREDLFYFKENYLLILNKDKLQDKMLRAISANQKVQITSNRQTKKSYAVDIYALWLFNFYQKKSIGIVSDRLMYVKYQISNITNLYNCIPEWMRVKSKNLKMSMTSEMGSRILTNATNYNTFRGSTIDVLIIENAATIKPNNLRECLEVMLPSISYQKDYKIIVLEKNSVISSDFHEVNENTILEAPVKVEKPILRRTFKQIIKDIIESLYNKIKG